MTRRLLSISGPSVTYRAAATSSAPTTSTNLRACSLPIAASGTSKAWYVGEPGTRMRPNMPGVSTRSGLAEHGAAADRARRTVDHVVDEIHVAAMHEILLVEQLERDVDAALAARHLLAAVRETLVAQIGRFVEGEFEADRIERHDGGQHRGVAGRAAGDEIARRNAAVADAAGDRRAQLGEFEVELRLTTAASLAATEAVAARNAWVRWSKVCSVMVRSRTSCLPRSRSASAKARLALACASVPRDLRDRVLERPLVDGEQKVALFDRPGRRESGSCRDSPTPVRESRPN